MTLASSSSRPSSSLPMACVVPALGDDSDYHASSPLDRYFGKSPLRPVVGDRAECSPLLLLAQVRLEEGYCRAAALVVALYAGCLVSAAVDEGRDNIDRRSLLLRLLVHASSSQCLYAAPSATRPPRLRRRFPPAHPLIISCSASRPSLSHQFRPDSPHHIATHSEPLVEDMPSPRLVVFHDWYAQ